MSPWSRLPTTLVTWISSRTRSNVIGSAEPGRRTTMRTFDPAGPRMMLTSLSMRSPRMGLPLTARILLRTRPSPRTFPRYWLISWF